MPSSSGPFAAPSRDDPDPYSLPASTMHGTPSPMYFTEASKIDMVCPLGKCLVMPPSEPGASWLRRRTLANVPRTITSWLPRREPYELKSLGGTPCSCKYFPAGLLALIDPAGEMWSVVTLWPSFASTRAPLISLTAAGRAGILSKYGARLMYVESRSHT